MFSPSQQQHAIAYANFAVLWGCFFVCFFVYNFTCENILQSTYLYGICFCNIFLLLIFPFPFCFPFVCARCMNVWFPTAIKRMFGKTYIAIHSVFLHLAGAYYEHPMFVVHSYAHKETSVL